MGLSSLDFNILEAQWVTKRLSNVGFILLLCFSKWKTNGYWMGPLMSPGAMLIFGDFDGKTCQKYEMQKQMNFCGSMIIMRENGCSVRVLLKSIDSLIDLFIYFFCHLNVSDHQTHFEICHLSGWFYLFQWIFDFTSLKVRPRPNCYKERILFSKTCADHVDQLFKDFLIKLFVRLDHIFLSLRFNFPCGRRIHKLYL